MSWSRYEGRALADATSTGDALLAELEDHIRVHNPHLTDVRLERASEAEQCDQGGRARTRWYTVTYLADDGEGQQPRR